MAEPQYQRCFDQAETEGPVELGVMAGQAWRDDPKHLAFTLSRYKFVSKMLDGYVSVAEIGCGDAWASAIVREQVSRLDLYDLDPKLSDGLARRHDITERELPCDIYDAIYALDVFEHIDRPVRFIRHVCSSLKEHGVLILGVPSLESQRYASPLSKAGHVNCKSGEEFREWLRPYFRNVFLFGMNDEVVHTGFLPMAHYLLAVCCTPIR